MLPLWVRPMILLAVEEWLTWADNPTDRLHPFTTVASIPKPLGVWPEMPAASVVLSPTNQNPIPTDLTWNPGLGRDGLGIAPDSG